MSSRGGNLARAEGIRLKQARNFILQSKFYDEETDVAEWTAHQDLFAPKVTPPPPTPPAAQGAAHAPAAPPAAPGAAHAPAPPAAQDGAAGPAGPGVQAPPQE